MDKRPAPDFSKLPSVIKFYTPHDLIDEYVNIVVESPSHFRYWIPTSSVVNFPGIQVPHDGRYWKTGYWVVNGELVSLEELKERKILGKDRVVLMEVYTDAGISGRPEYKLAGYVLTLDTRAVIKVMTEEDAR